MKGAQIKWGGVTMKTTMKDIAQACGVSIGLVSRIINRDETIRCSAETKERVLKEIERTGYTPNYHAKTLANNSIKPHKDIRIGYLTYKGAEELMVNAYFDKIIEGITGILQEDYQLYPFYADEVMHYCKKNIPLTEKKLDGLIVFGTLPDVLLDYLSGQAKYISSVYSAVRDNIDFVGCDMLYSMNVVLDYVKSLGYTEIGLVLGGDKARDDALIAYAKGIDLKINPLYCYYGMNISRHAHQETLVRLQKGAPPKMICCMNDEMAIGVMRALLEQGYSVPGDVSVTGHDDILKANYAPVPLTTVRIYKEEIGRLVTNLLLERINYKRKFAVKMFVPCELVIRKSTKKNKEEKDYDGN